jgi:hypothetical protein
MPGVFTNILIYRYTEGKMDIELRIPSPDDLTTQAPREARPRLSRPSMTQVDVDAFTHELSAEPAVHPGLIRSVVRAFLAAALRGLAAHTPEGWRSVIQDLRYVLGSALGAGVEDQRPVRPHDRPALPASMVEADSVGAPRLPVRFVHAFVRAYVAGRMSGDEGTTPEGRSRILGETRELVWDGMLDAVKQVPCPPTPPPQSPARAPRRTPPGRQR